MTATRVLNPAVLTEFCKLRASPVVGVRTSRPCGHQLTRVKRDLFGQANEAEKRIIAEQLEQFHECATQKWGFDFRTGVPLSFNSRYIWESVSYQESNQVPHMYTLTRAAHMRHDERAPTTMDLLMDERAERENLRSTSFSESTDNESCDESHDEAATLAVFKVPTLLGHTDMSATSSMSPQTRKRQPKITDYMKERKRLAQTPKKVSPAKRMRTSPSSAASSASQYSTISAHFAVRSLQRNN